MEREQLTIHLPVALKEQIQKEAEEKGMSFNSMFNFLMQCFGKSRYSRDFRSSHCTKTLK